MTDTRPSACGARVQDGGSSRRRDEEGFAHEHRLHADRLQRRREMTASLGVPDEELLDALAIVGYDRDTIGLVDLAPLIEVAWADGHVTEAQRTLVVAVASERGVLKCPVIGHQLMAWLAASPPDRFFRVSICAVRARCDLLEPGQADAFCRRLVEDCVRVAAASRAWFGVGPKVSARARAALDHIAAALGIVRTRPMPDGARADTP